MNVAFAANPPKNSSLAEIARISPRRALLEKAAAEELASLTAPPSVAQLWRTIVSDRMVLADELAQLGRAATRKDAATIAKLSKSKARLHATLLKLSKRLELRDCAHFG